jgi:hypothetical protein
MNLVLQRSGHRGTGSDLASSFAHYGTRVSGPQVGAIAVMGRRGGGHVGIITGIDASGNPIMISERRPGALASCLSPRLGGEAVARRQFADQRCKCVAILMAPIRIEKISRIGQNEPRYCCLVG